MLSGVGEWVDVVREWEWERKWVSAGVEWVREEWWCDVWCGVGGVVLVLRGGCGEVVGGVVSGGECVVWVGVGGVGVVWVVWVWWVW